MIRLIAILIMAGGACGAARADGISDGQRCAATGNDPDVAINYCVRAIYSGDLNGEQLAATFYNRGVEYKKKGDYEQAIKDFDSAIKLRPDFVRAYNSRGVAYFETGEDALAIADFDGAIEMMPGEASLRRNRGMIRFYRSEFAAAAPDMRAAMQLAPDDAQGALWLFLAEARSGLMAGDALGRFAAGRDLNPWPGPAVAMFLGMIGPEVVVGIGRAAFAEGDARRQCQAYFYVGQFQLMQGMRGNAAEFFRAAVASGAVGAMEYTGAGAELARMGEHGLTAAGAGAN